MTLIADVFSQDAFGFLSMTEALVKTPYIEARLGQLIPFKEESLETDVAVVDSKDGIIQVLSTKPRGAEPQRADADSLKNSRAFKVPHLPFEDRILAASLLGKRKLGQNQLESVAEKVAERLAWMRQQMEVTFEIHRLNALKGILKDADGTTIFNFFTEFGVTQQTHDFAFSVSTTDVRNEFVAALRKMEAELGGMSYTRGHVIAGKNWFDTFVGNAKVAESVKYQDSVTLRTDLRRGYEYAGVTVEEYRGFVGLTADIGIVGDDEAYLFPMGVNDMFSVYAAPADFMETVNTMGQLMYAKAAPDMKYNKYVDLYAESNPLFMNKRPRAVIKLTNS